MDGFLAARITNRGWLGKPRLSLFPEIASIVGRISMVRATLAAVYLYLVCTGDPRFQTEAAQRRQAACVFVAFLLGITDWIPFTLCTWQRQPSILTKWATPAMGMVSCLFHIAWVFMAMNDRPDFLSRMAAAGVALCYLAVTTIETLLMTAGWLYFTFYPPIRRPLAYEPRLEVFEQDQGPIDNEGPDLTDYPAGPIERLYLMQQSSSYSIEERRDEGEEQEPEQEETDHHVFVRTTLIVQTSLMLLTEILERQLTRAPQISARPSSSGTKN